ncbi:LysR family transcriptional regulator [Povalibacter sp.]|uniref:LysR family transcriptional regulator n=1 Tax=Povalibacter sp. TaxID=1962978 RepID=UPI002F4106B9
MDNLSQIDLNLLVTLETLLTERSVTRAAQRLHLSQPSVSVQLRKLREIFSDPLLLSSQGRGGMLPTTRAQALLPAVRSALDEIRRVVAPSAPFDPQTSQVTWQIAAADYAEYAIVLPLLTTLRRMAPGMRVSLRHAGHAQIYRQLESGAIDLALLAMDTAPDHLHRRVLYKEDYVLIARKKHPALKRKLTLDTFTKLEYIVVSPEGGGFKGVTDTMLESRGRKREVMLSTQHFLLVPEVVGQTDLVAVAPSRLVNNRADRLQILAPPLRIPSYEMGMIWHDRSHTDPAHAWLREQIELVSQASPQ